MRSFGKKLNWLKATFRVTDSQIGAAAGASASLVCRWRKGQRSLDRAIDSGALKRLALFFARRAEETGQAAKLGMALSLGQTDLAGKGEPYCSAFFEFLYGDGEISREAPDSVPEPQPERRESVFGIEGLLAALDVLEKRARGISAPMSVYLSLEHSRIIRDPSAGKLLETLWRIGGGQPVRIVFDHWADADEAAKTLRVLLPFTQSGTLRLHLIQSPQKFFYSNVSFYAEGVGLVVTAEPVIGLGDSVSMFVDSRDYVEGMRSVFSRFDKIAKPLVQHLNPEYTRAEAVCFARLLEPPGDLRVAIDGASLLYLDAKAFMDLLKLNGITGSQRAYRFERFEHDKRRFEAFLETGRLTEIFSLPALDSMVAAGQINTPDFSFFSGAIRANNDILACLFAEMIRLLRIHENLSVYLARSGLPHAGFSTRLKSDSFVLQHYFGDGKPHAFWSDNWLLVYECVRQFRELLQDGDLIMTKEAALEALQIRLDNLGLARA